MDDLLFRPACPEDVDQAVPLIYSSGPDMFDYIFSTQKTSAIDFLRYEFVTEKGVMAYGHHTVVEKDGKVIGIGSFHAGTDNWPLTLGTLKNLVIFFKWNLMPVVRRSLQSGDVITNPANDMLYIAHVGIAPEQRGQGIGRALLEYKKAFAVQHGYRGCVLDVSIGNSQAQALYERLGFLVTKKSLFKYADHIPGQYRMELAL